MVVLVPEGQDPPADTLQTIARNLNPSKTAFIALNATSKSAESRVRVFTADTELPLAGHPAIDAALYALCRLGSGADKAKLCVPAGSMEIAYCLRTGVEAIVNHSIHVHTQVHKYTSTLYD